MIHSIFGICECPGPDPKAKAPPETAITSESDGCPRSPETRWWPTGFERSLITSGADLAASHPAPDIRPSSGFRVA